ncbi:MAG: hypothetical protein R2810_09595 [Flavobacteriales bacterium]|nr:hypothetical protein [Flavobacteriales bacterium]
MTLPLDPKEWSASVLQQVFTPDEGPGDHSVIINFYRSLPDLDHLHALEMKLRRAVEDHGVGEHDGHEVAWDLSHGTLFLYGPNAEALFRIVKPYLDATPFMQGAECFLRFGGPGEDVPELTVVIGA